jgi:hypothetical protein
VGKLFTVAALLALAFLVGRGLAHLGVELLMRHNAALFWGHRLRIR